MKYKLYEVGGKIRDELLGIDSKDVDYSVVVPDVNNRSIDEVFFNFVAQLESEGFEIFLTTPDCYTIRAKFPKNHKYEGVADFVLARKEIGYEKTSRKPVVTVGTLADDLRRRDFTVNALAKDINGDIIDLFGGQKDLQDMILRTPTDTAVSFNDDPLRILRAIRFAVTKGFEFSDELWTSIDIFDYRKMSVVSAERIREELYKSFKYDTMRTFEYLRMVCLQNYPLYKSFFPEGLWLEPTMKK